MAGRSPFLRRYQARTFFAIVRALARRPGATQTVLFPRQAGKNELAAALVVFLLLSHARRGGSVIVCAPTMAPQGEISRRRVLAALSAVAHLLPRAVRPRSDGPEVRVGRASVTFLSASPEAHVAGHTASLLLIADEAQEIDEAWFERQFRPMTASTGASTVLFGTPWDGETLLDRAVERNRRHDTNAPVALHHQVDWPEVAAASAAYGAHVERERARLGESHPLFATQYGLVCVADSGRLFTAADLAGLEGSHQREEAPAPGIRYVAGLDLGGEGAGSDASVLTIARVVGRCCEVAAHVAWEGAAMAEVGRAVLKLAGHWRIERLAVDATGLGQPLARELERELGERVDAVNFSGSVKSDLGYALLAAVRSGRLKLYRDDGSRESRSCRAELAACRARFSGPAMRWAAPAGGHDDYAVSLALCLRAAEGLGVPRVAIGRARG